MGARRQLSVIDSVIIHHAETPNGHVFTAEQIDQWHEARHFERDMSICPGYSPLKHIGYHYVIELDGTIQRGRPLEEVGAHTYGKNPKSIGICLIGMDKFALVQWQQLLNLIQSLDDKLATSLAVYGHNQFSPKTCPGFNVPAWISRKFRPLDQHILEGDFHGVV
ncbi:N-acetylmuramoyl-L-alanine amidase [Marinomonas spartinae]|uniref:N-acetylmuramoyl-L-alanine amidase n=1 Tax=Marinomonas spartinae TaxID=1792290 RepID=UPI0018F19B46|nr:N-acetylmuramoyl-L-alanine amidase [Marinomonas spartinae]MBJ7553134.1 N-acetylmuramoyl-L-alanine amidase [Marinomonas spartinae]